MRRWVRRADARRYPLIAEQDGAVQVAGDGSTKQFVFNAEAHPLKVRGPPV